MANSDRLAPAVGEGEDARVVGAGLELDGASVVLYSLVELPVAVVL
jgi:hypothetical protein